MVKRRFPRWSEFKPLLQPPPVQLSATARRLRKATSVDDLRTVAKKRTPRAVFDYTDGGAEDEVALKRSRAALERIEFRPNVLRDVSRVDTTTTMLGSPAELPVVLAPTGYTRMMHHSGEPAVARAAGRAGLPYVLSTMGTTSLEALEAASPETRRWFQLFLWKDRAASADFVARAAETGCDTLVLTVDTPVGGSRRRDQRNGMTIPPSLTLRTVVDGARHPHWWLNFLTTEPLEFASLSHFDGSPAELTNLIFDPSSTVADVAWLRDIWSGSLVVKGVQHAEDAAMVVDAGADAVVLSNHGGRQLDRAATPLEQLSDTVRRVGERAEVYVDGGFRSGSDVAAAVALGARGVWIGRSYLYGLMAGGEAGVDRSIELMRKEFVATMQLLGVKSVDELNPDLVVLRDVDGRRSVSAEV
ncbi:alpha-hydroxy-acid oxidizing enzyme [Gordonia jinghuaiqii]|uniref:Alpha-hydroxy-acid oxidizing protein n=2 Tax=Gordonia jinghuaiqii TaxID=2758710 RepID=A0A7D7R0Q2_9ACTN|nr:alpha-hydroxy-acid oxidizing enzyme [Gordonia jinghuaiqii]QMT03709.1 alpha-hydroxy-acid oxidizing protein [Gordonia jinghuaiqii]